MSWSGAFCYLRIFRVFSLGLNGNRLDLVSNGGRCSFWSRNLKPFNISLQDLVDMLKRPWNSAFCNLDKLGFVSNGGTYRFLRRTQKLLNIFQGNLVDI